MIIWRVFWQEMKKLICFRQMSDERKWQRGADDRRTDILPSAQQELPIVFRLKRILAKARFPQGRSVPRMQSPGNEAVSPGMHPKSRLCRRSG